MSEDKGLTPKKTVPKILIVDDDENNVVLINEILASEGHKLFSAANGLEALRILEEEDIHLVISDIRMPQMDGIETLKEIKKRKPHLEVILMTAFGEVKSYLDAMDLGAFDYFNKPFDFKMFRDFVNRALKRSMAARGE